VSMGHEGQIDPETWRRVAVVMALGGLVALLFAALCAVWLPGGMGQWFGWQALFVAAAAVGVAVWAAGHWRRGA